jgi:hypothetical protein
MTRARENGLGVPEGVMFALPVAIVLWAIIIEIIITIRG